MPVITLRRPDTCRDCGAPLAVGDRARYYGPGKIYGTTCHAKIEAEAAAQAEAEMEPIYRDADLRAEMRDPGEDASDRWNETQQGMWS